MNQVQKNKKWILVKKTTIALLFLILTPQSKATDGYSEEQIKRLRDPWNYYSSPQITVAKNSSGKDIPDVFIAQVCVVWDEAVPASTQFEYIKLGSPRYCRLARYVELVSKEKVIEMAQKMDLMQIQSLYLQMKDIESALNKRDTALSQSINGLTDNQVVDEIRKQVFQEVKDSFYKGEDYQKFKAEIKRELLIELKQDR